MMNYYHKRQFVPGGGDLGRDRGRLVCDRAAPRVISLNGPSSIRAVLG